MYVRRATTRSRRDGGSYFTYRLVRSERVGGGQAGDAANLARMFHKLHAPSLGP